MNPDDGQLPGAIGGEDVPRRAKADGQRLDLLIVIPHLGPGGAQRVASLLANHWQLGDRRVGLVTLYDEPPDAHELSPDIVRLSMTEPRLRTIRGRRPRIPGWVQTLRVRLSPALSPLKGPYIAATKVGIGRIKSSIQIFQRILSLRAVFRQHKPPVVISFLGATNIQTVLAAYRLPCKVVISERNDPALQALNPPWERLRPIVYPRADMVTANSLGAVESLGAYVAAKRLRQVQNPLMIRPCDTRCRRHQPRLISVARLVHQKGIDVLLDAFAAIADVFPDWELDIVGGGPLEDELKQQAGDLHIRDRVTFHGHQSDPFPLLYQASVFVLPSRFEGMPNAMLEAMGCGLSIVATTASPGPLEFIQDGMTGLLVAPDDAVGLSRALGRLIGDAPLRHRLSVAAAERVRSLDVATVAGHWEHLIREVAQRELFPPRMAGDDARLDGAAGAEHRIADAVPPCDGRDENCLDARR